MKKIYTCIIATLPLFFFCDLQAQITGCTSNISPANSSTNVDPFPDITLKWTPVNGATSYDIYVGAKVPPTQLIGTVLTDTFNFINASYSTTYNWYVVPKNASGNAIGCVSTSTAFVTSPPPPPPINDNCSGAIDISTVPLNGTTLGATQSQPADLCNGYTGTADDDVWYKFTPLANGTTIITLTGNGSFDGVLEAFSGSCGSLTSLTCSDSSQGGGREQITLNVTAGTTYTLRVYGFYADLSNRGTFSISSMSAPLPVTLLNFTGERRDNKNLLKWSTATELNNQGFEVQYSTDGNNFDAISFVNSKSKNGNSASVINYEFIDGRTLYGNAWYRLKQVDKDGRPNFSNIIFLKGEKINAMSFSNIYPNPAKNKLNITIAAPANNKINLEIRDLLGKVVMQQATTIINGDNNLSIDVARLPSGSYFIKAISNNGSQIAVSKFVKE